MNILCNLNHKEKLKITFHSEKKLLMKNTLGFLISLFYFQNIIEYQKYIQ